MAIQPRSTDHDATLPFREAAKKGDMALKSYVDQKFRGSGWVSDHILDGMVESQDFYASEMVQVKVPSLHRGRFVVVGDAGYAAGPTGNGTSLALAGAYILAGEICKHDGDVAAGLRGYEERMRPIIDDMQKLPPGIPGVMAPQTAVGIWLRNLVFRIACWAMKFKGLFAWASGTVAVIRG